VIVGHAIDIAIASLILWKYLTIMS